MALHRFVCALRSRRSRGWSGSSYIGRSTAARSATRTSNPRWALARSANHSPIGSPARPGRVLAMMIVRLVMGLCGCGRRKRAAQPGGPRVRGGGRAQRARGPCDYLARWLVDRWARLLLWRGDRLERCALGLERCALDLERCAFDLERWA